MNKSSTQNINEEVPDKVNYSYKVVKSIECKNGELYLVFCDISKSGKENYYLLKKLEIESDEEKRRLVKEISKIQNMNCKYIIQIYDFFFEKNEQKEMLCILMDYYEKGNLKQLVKLKEDFNSRNLWRIFIQIILGLNAVHSNNIIAKNLNSQNIFIDDENNIKICGFCPTIDFNKKTDDYSTFLYHSPEVIDGQDFNKRSDIWSVGCILYELITKKKPFYLIENIQRIKYERSIIHDNDFEYFLSKLLCYEKSRITVNQLFRDKKFVIKMIEENLIDEKIIKGKYIYI